MGMPPLLLLLLVDIEVYVCMRKWKESLSVLGVQLEPVKLQTE